MKYKCNCCGYFTLDDPENGSYEICPVCFWENDWVQNNDPSYWGGANKPSLIEARRNFERYGAVEQRLAGYVRAPLPEEHSEPS
ncbi:CPCC family cysteine-rich protein [Microbacterium jejuense]|uniref:CPCC family cysteine-rich protein n=1 Tax=Microbacterium jejuense TaxID=1263637 RepID=UPI0031E61CDE